MDLAGGKGRQRLGLGGFGGRGALGGAPGGDGHDEVGARVCRLHDDGRQRLHDAPHGALAAVALPQLARAPWVKMQVVIRLYFVFVYLGG